jgi:CRP/FNR family transcriptional regulator
MRTPSKFKIQHQCSHCALHTDGYFCELSESAKREFEALKITNSYSKGSTLFNQGQPAKGIYMLCQGRVKLCSYSRDGRSIIFRVAEPGEVLGLSAVVSDCEYEATAEVVESCQVNFVRKSDFVRFIHEHPEAGFGAIKQLSQSYHAAFNQARSLALSATVADKLARLFLEWPRSSNGSNGEARLKVDYTHEEIAAMIGTTRETVTRLMNDFKRRNLIHMDGSDLYIHDMRQFESIIGMRTRDSERL